MTENLKPLPKFILKEIRKILTGCQTGKLKHTQSDIHCGTAHCICGWKQVFDLAKPENDKTLITEFWDRKIKQSAKHLLGLAWEYSQQQWRLTHSEAEILFSGLATFKYQFALLEYLEAGHRTNRSCQYLETYSEETKEEYILECGRDFGNFLNTKNIPWRKF